MSESHKNAKKCIFFKNKSSILGGNDVKVPTLLYCVNVSIYRFLEIFYTKNMFKKCQNHIKMPKNAYLSKISHRFLVEMTQRFIVHTTISGNGVTDCARLSTTYKGARFKRGNHFKWYTDLFLEVSQILVYREKLSRYTHILEVNAHNLQE